MIDPMQQQMSEPVDSMAGADPSVMPPDGIDPAAGDPGLDPATADPTAQEPAAPEPEPLDPITAAIQGVMLLDPKEAVRRVYSLAVSASRTKAKADAAGDSLDARRYHDLQSANPEVRFVRELQAARRRLDTLAGERRRLALEVGKRQAAGKGNMILDAQLAAAEMAIEQVAKGVLLFLSLPSPEGLDQ